jgi:hypothetical protein
MLRVKETEELNAKDAKDRNNRKGGMTEMSCSSLRESSSRSSQTLRLIYFE